MTSYDVDAVVIGAGHNGLVAANLLADAGWSVEVLEATDRLGGAVYSDRSLHPDYTTDWFSAFYPFGAASPVLRALDLGAHGLEWVHAPSVLAHLLPDGRVALLSRDRHRTAASVDAFAAGDGAAWLDLLDRFETVREPLLEALFTPFPPVRAAAGLARRLGTAELLRLARFVAQPVRRASAELFAGEGARLLLAGNALHTDLAPEAAGSAVFGWLLAMLGQTDGYPVPRGGSGRLSAALAARLAAAGGAVRTGCMVTRVEVVDGRAVAVRSADGRRRRARAVLADVAAPILYRDLVGEEHLPPRLVTDLARFQWDSPTLKVDWALSGRIPWRADGVHGAGTVHLGADLDGLTRYSADLATGRPPEHPFVLLGQMTTADQSRSPAGTESAWAYTHLPDGIRAPARVVREQCSRVEAAIERHAPGFRDLVLARRVQSPDELERANASLVGGAVNGGTASIHQQLIFRPVPGLARAETVIRGLYLAGSSAHPGGGVHGGPGANAARAALRHEGRGLHLSRRVIDLAHRAIYR